jgi:hypothetical protein
MANLNNHDVIEQFIGASTSNNWDLNITNLLDNHPSLLGTPGLQQIQINDYSSGSESENDKENDLIKILSQNQNTNKISIVRNKDAVKGMEPSMHKHHSGPIKVKRITDPIKNSKSKHSRVKTIFKKVFYFYYF